MTQFTRFQLLGDPLDQVPIDCLVQPQGEGTEWGQDLLQGTRPVTAGYFAFPQSLQELDHHLPRQDAQEPNQLGRRLQHQLGRVAVMLVAPLHLFATPPTAVVL